MSASRKRERIYNGDTRVFLGMSRRPRSQAHQRKIIREWRKRIAEEIVRRFVDQEMRPGGFFHALVNGESQGDVVQPRGFLVGSESPELFVPRVKTDV